MCKEYGTELLGSLPLDIASASRADSGKPTVSPTRRAGRRRSTGRSGAGLRSRRGVARDMTSKFPNIVVSKKHLSGPSG